jgi:amidohydrolase
LLAGLCGAMQLEYNFDYQWVYPPTVNDAAMNDVVRAVARELVPREDVVDPHPIVMWSEDMSFMQQQRPGAYFLVGARGRQMGHEPHHSARFDVDERALEIGFNMLVGLGLRGLV